MARPSLQFLRRLVFLDVSGDSTSPSRFIRALAYTSTVVPAKDAAENVRLAEHVLRNFDIPRGSIRSKAGDDAFIELTQWSTISDLNNQCFYFSTYDYQSLRMVDLKNTDLNKQKITVFKIDQKLQTRNVSP